MTPDKKVKILATLGPTTNGSVAWGVHSVVNDRLRQVDEVCSTALEIAQAQGMAQRGDTLVITAGVPFGQPGSTNSLRIETLI
ncbi:hypothetical protein ACR52_23300 [Pseudomonas fildesensis]|uniref:Pyruvate kinase C-terminal domain-containing protein n=1 Tax=Pseudomonas fildesensis TaxID=1674920 RepID=A0A0J8FXQ2_9PSED|nr:hypothetical protein ACR52_23300 [Pseudomonas fildesensis]